MSASQNSEKWGKKQKTDHKFTNILDLMLFELSDFAFAGGSANILGRTLLMNTEVRVLKGMSDSER